MSAILLRDQLISKLDTLDDEQIENVLQYVELLQAYKLPADYDPANDPMLNGESSPIQVSLSLSSTKQTRDIMTVCRFIRSTMIQFQFQ